MNISDTTRVLAYMTTAWPTHPLTENGAEVWAEHLDPHEAADCWTAAREMVAASRWFPSIAEFLEVVREARRRRTPALVWTPEPYQQPCLERRRAILAEARALRGHGNGDA